MDILVGQIQLFPYTFTPKGWAPCKGQLLQINQNTVLFSLLGTSFGGDGRQTFALPNLQGKEPAPNLQYFIAVEGTYPSRD
jgi:microcystin-dependent protein